MIIESDTIKLKALFLNTRRLS